MRSRPGRCGHEPGLNTESGPARRFLQVELNVWGPFPIIHDGGQDCQRDGDAFLVGEEAGAIYKGRAGMPEKSQSSFAHAVLISASMVAVLFLVEGFEILFHLPLERFGIVPRTAG